MGEFGTNPSGRDFFRNRKKLIPATVHPKIAKEVGSGTVGVELKSETVSVEGPKTLSRVLASNANV